MFTSHHVLFILITILWPKGHSDNTCPATCNDNVFFKLICPLVPHRLGALTRASKKKKKKRMLPPGK